MRDYRSLKAFQVAHRFALETYRTTAKWPKEEQFGLTNQIRRAAVSCASNLVEGCSRNSQKEWCRYIEISFGSAREAKYQLGLASELGMLVGVEAEELADECCRVLHGLLKANE